jgi:hypothetical protein
MYDFDKFDKLFFKNKKYNIEKVKNLSKIFTEKIKEKNYSIDLLKEIISEYLYIAKYESQFEYRKSLILSSLIPIFEKIKEKICKNNLFNFFLKIEEKLFIYDFDRTFNSIEENIRSIKNHNFNQYNYINNEIKIKLIYLQNYLVKQMQELKSRAIDVTIDKNFNNNLENLKNKISFFNWFYDLEQYLSVLKEKSEDLEEKLNKFFDTFYNYIITNEIQKNFLNDIFNDLCYEIICFNNSKIINKNSNTKKKIFNNSLKILFTNEEKKFFNIKELKATAKEFSKRFKSSNINTIKVRIIDLIYLTKYKKDLNKKEEKIKEFLTPIINSITKKESNNELKKVLLKIEESFFLFRVKEFFYNDSQELLNNLDKPLKTRDFSQKQIKIWKNTLRNQIDQLKQQIVKGTIDKNFDERIVIGNVGFLTYPFCESRKEIRKFLKILKKYKNSQNLIEQIKELKNKIIIKEFQIDHWLKLRKKILIFITFEGNRKLNNDKILNV